eukprot:2553375-Rhodomonas_salina.4
MEIASCEVRGLFQPPRWNLRPLCRRPQHHRTRPTRWALSVDRRHIPQSMLAWTKSPARPPSWSQSEFELVLPTTARTTPSWETRAMRKHATGGLRANLWHGVLGDLAARVEIAGLLRGHVVGPGK